MIYGGGPGNVLRVSEMWADLATAENFINKVLTDIEEMEDPPPLVDLAVDRGAVAFPTNATLKGVGGELTSAIGRQGQSFRDIVTLTPQLLVFSGALLGVVIGLQPPSKPVYLALFLFAVWVYVAIVGVSLWKLVQPQGWSGGLNPRIMWDLYGHVGDSAWKRKQVLEANIRAYEYNKERLGSRRRWLRGVSIALVIWLIGLLTLVLAQAWTQRPNSTARSTAPSPVAAQTAK